MTQMNRDSGLQAERTALSWRRTGLSLLIGALILCRLAVEHGGSLAVVLIVIGIAIAAWSVIGAFRRGRMALVSAVDPHFRSLLRDGRLPAAICVTVALLSLAELAVIAHAV